MSVMHDSRTDEISGNTGNPVSVLIVDTDPDLRSACVEMARTLGYQVRSSSDLDESREILNGGLADILVLHLPWGTTEALNFVSEVKLLRPRISIIVMTGSTSVYNAVEAMRRGASDYLTKPFLMDDFCLTLEQATKDVVAQMHPERDLQIRGVQEVRARIIGRSASLEGALHAAAKMANSNVPVLVLGESGTGKEMIARSIHRLGKRSHQPFLPVDCSSLVPSLIESELFGYVKGAFTGAVKDKDGLFVSAGEGTVLLDEIGELPLFLQAKLLRVLQEKEVRPVGSSRRLAVRARIIAATNQDLVSMVKSGSFRQDLYYRLSAVTVRVPPLRKRKDDIPLLVSHFLNKYRGKRQLILTRESMQILQSYDWPGNVRELENAIERACALTDAEQLEPTDLPTEVQKWKGMTNSVKNGKSLQSSEERSKIQSLEEIERKAIIDAIKETQGDKVKAAQLLGIGKTTLYRKLREYRIADGEQKKMALNGAADARS